MLDWIPITLYTDVHYYMLGMIALLILLHSFKCDVRDQAIISFFKNFCFFFAVLFLLYIGPRHIITDNEDGMVTPYRDLNIFAEKLTELMNDEQLRSRMGEKGCVNIDRFDIAAVMRQWQKLFRQIAS